MFITTWMIKTGVYKCRKWHTEYSAYINEQVNLDHYKTIWVVL